VVEKATEFINSMVTSS